MAFTKLPIMGKNVDITLSFKNKEVCFQIEPEKWSEKRTSASIERKPLGIGQKRIKRATTTEYELSFSGAKVSGHLQRILTTEDLLHATGDSLAETDFKVTISITNPNDAEIERREYTEITIQDSGTDAGDLEGSVEESVTLSAKTRKLFFGTVEETGTWGA